MENNAYPYKPQSKSREELGEYRARRLLHRAVIAIHDELEAMVSQGCALSIELTPIPGTCDPDMVPLINDYVTLVQDIEAEIGPMTKPIEPWMDSLLKGQWSLLEGGPA